MAEDRHVRADSQPGQGQDDNRAQPAIAQNFVDPVAPGPEERKGAQQKRGDRRGKMGLDDRPGFKNGGK